MADIDFALEYAARMHAGQTRKYTGRPVTEHHKEVYIGAKEHGLSSQAQIAAILHDVVEDTTATLDNICEVFGYDVGKMVFWLTNETVRVISDELLNKFREEDPVVFIQYQLLLDVHRMPRKIKTIVECARIIMAPDEVKALRILDIKSNINELSDQDLKFSLLYISEKERLMYSLRINNMKLWDEVFSIIRTQRVRFESIKNKRKSAKV